jgi:hypothetical protein
MLIFTDTWNSQFVNMSFTKVLFVMFNDPVQPIARWLKYHLKILKSDVIPQFLKCRENFFRVLQICSPSVFLWNLWKYKSCTDWCLASRVDKELWESSRDVIHWHRQLDAHCGTLSCPCAQKNDHGFLSWKTLLLIKQWRKYVLNEIFLVIFLPFREGIQGN